MTMKENIDPRAEIESEKNINIYSETQNNLQHFVHSSIVDETNDEADECV